MDRYCARIPAAAGAWARVISRSCQVAYPNCRDGTCVTSPTYEKAAVMRMRSLVGVLVGVGLWTCGTGVFGQAQYAKIADIPIGGAGAFDYLARYRRHRLYVTHGTEIVVIDTTTNKIVGRIADTPRVHGIAIVPELGRGFTTNGGENKVSIVDLKTLATIRRSRPAAIRMRCCTSRRGKRSTPSTARRRAGSTPRSSTRRRARRRHRPPWRQARDWPGRSGDGPRVREPRGQEP